MANKENNNKNNKKSNVIYIDRNKRTSNSSNKNTANKNKSNRNSASTKNVTSINKNSGNNNKNTSVNKNKEIKRKPKSVNKGTNPVNQKENKAKNSQNKAKQTKSNSKSKQTKPKNKGTNIKWGRVAIAVALLIVIGFGGFKGIQMIKNKSSKAPITATNKVEDDNLSVSKDNPTSKGQYDLEDEKNQESKKYNIVVDAGHGGNDKGSLDSTETVYEKDIALQIAKKVASRLGRESDVNVIMTRSEDKYVSLEERAEIAKRANADALISVHLNAQKKFGDANGLETWYRGGATDGSKELASAVQKTTASYVEITSRGILRNNFEILRETTMPAVLIECGFITNVSDMEKLKNPNYQDMLAEGIMQGTLSFLDEKNQKN